MSPTDDILTDTVVQLERIHGVMIDIIPPSGAHRYRSTHCRHDDHAACSATTTVDGGSRSPAQCEKCAAPCVCPCHPEVDTPAVDVLD